MKILAFIMAFLVLALTFMPCEDKSNTDNESKTRTVLAKTTNQQGPQQMDDCSPFCHCACCAGFSINYFIPAIAIIPQYKPNPSSSFLPSEVIEVALSIWQPPQLV